MNGFLAWKLICAEFQPQVGGRHNAMLTALLHPDWSRSADFEVGKAAWEKNIIQYEAQSGERFTSSMRIATICKYAPPAARDAARMADLTSMDD